MKLTRTVKFNALLFPVVPLVNVLFLVLLFFALSNGFLLQPGVAVALPVSSFAMRPQRNAELVTVVSNPTTIFFRDRGMELEEFQVEITQRPGTRRSLVVQADRGVQYELVAKITNHALLNGYSVILAGAEQGK